MTATATSCAVCAVEYSDDLVGIDHPDEPVEYICERFIRVKSTGWHRETRQRTYPKEPDRG